MCQGGLRETWFAKSRGRRKRNLARRGPRKSRQFHGLKFYVHHLAPQTRDGVYSYPTSSANLPSEWNTLAVAPFTCSMLSDIVTIRDTADSE